MVQVAFSLRPQHKLNFNVSKSTTGNTTTFTWTASITTSGNTNTPYGTGTYTHSTSPTTTYVSGNTNSATNFAYDYRSPNQNYTINLGSGVRSAPANGTNYTFTLDVSMGSLIGSATASVSIAADVSTPAPSAPTYLSASTTDSGGISLSWGGASGSITNYGIWYHPQSTGTPTAGDTPDFTTSSTSYYDTGAAQGTARYYWVRAQGPGGNSAWYPAGSGIYGYRAYPTFTYYFDAAGGDYIQYSSTSGQSGTAAYLPYVARTGYSFNGWYIGGSFVGYGGTQTTFGAYVDGATFTAAWSPITYSIFYNGNGNTGGSTATTYWNYPNSGTVANNGFTRDGYNFLYWMDGSGTIFYPGQTVYGDLVLYAQWAIAAIYPEYVDQSVASPVIINSSYSDGVYASNAVSYQIISGSLPPGLTINSSSGTIIGQPTTQGSHTFVVRATSSTGDTKDTPNLVIQVIPAGHTAHDNTSFTKSSIAKRYDSGSSSWVNVSVMKRWNGTAWVNLSN